MWPCSSRPHQRRAALDALRLLPVGFLDQASARKTSKRVQNWSETVEMFKEYDDRKGNVMRKGMLMVRTCSFVRLKAGVR